MPRVKKTETKEDVKMEAKTFESYNVVVKIKNLNLRKGPGKKYPKENYFCKPGLQTIVAEKNGYGKRPDGLWISLDFCERVND